MDRRIAEILLQLRAIGLVLIGAVCLAASGSFAAAGGDLQTLLSLGAFALACCFALAGAADLLLGVIDRSMGGK